MDWTRRPIQLFLFILFILLWGQESFAKKVRVALDGLRPLQKGIGEVELIYRLEKAQSERGYRRRLSTPLRPVIKGPKGQYYLDDGHHAMTLLQRLGQKTVQVNQVLDLSHLSEKEFFEELKRRKSVYLKHLGGEIHWSDLPRSLKGLEDDPFRSLVWFLKKSGGFEKSSIPFQEFYWADALRDLIEYDDTLPDERSWALRQAWKFSQSGDARSLPGYIPELRRGNLECKLDKYLEAIETLEP